MGGLMALLKMLASLADDVVLTFSKTSSVLVDDVAVGAAKSAQFGADKEGRMIFNIGGWAMLNKVILLPIIFVLDYYFPQVVIVALMIGGAFLAYEGMEKVVEYFFHHENAEKVIEGESDQEKVKSAVLIDFILSIEIIIISMASVQQADYTLKVITVSLVSFLAVFAVYGLIWLLVKMDDLGFWIKEEYKHPHLHKVANVLITSLPFLIKALAVIGTLAMLLVAGGIYIHNVELIHHFATDFDYGILTELLIGGSVGIITIIFISAVKFLFKK